MSTRYLIQVDDGEMSEEIPVCNSKAIAFGVFDTQCRKEGVFSVRLLDLKTGKTLKNYEYEGKVGAAHFG